MSEIFDLGIAWTWQFDKEFVSILEKTMLDSGFSSYAITKENLGPTFARLTDGTLGFRFFFDRASDEDDAFHPVADLLSRQAAAGGLRVINPRHLMMRAADKATMHLEFLSHGIRVPHTIILSPFHQKKNPDLSVIDLEPLGRSFIIKPANTTGGGTGVVLGARTVDDVLAARRQHKDDKYLLQETIQPASLSERRAWFRVFDVFGTIIPCWWDDQTHVYEALSTEDEEAFGLHPLRTITSQIEEICGLDFFSTEVAVDLSARFVVVDYVNEVCDMRLQSLHPDGVPDWIANRVAVLLLGPLKKGGVN